MTRKIFKSAKERDAVCAEALEAVRQLRLDTSDYARRALALLDTALAARPENTAALSQRAALRSRTGDVAGAVVDLSALIAADEEALRGVATPAILTAHARRRLAGLYGQRATLRTRTRPSSPGGVSGESTAGPDSDAMADYLRAMEWEPDSPTWPYELGIAHVRLADAHERSQGATVAGGSARSSAAAEALRQAAVFFTSALHCCQAALSVSPVAAGYRSPVRQARSSADGGVGSAGTSAGGGGGGGGGGKAVAALKFRCLVNLGLCGLRSGDVALAVRVLRLAQEERETAHGHCLLGLAYDRAGDAAAAAVAFRRATEADAYNTEYALQSSISELRSGLHAEAVTRLAAAVVLEPRNAQLHFYRGCASAMAGDDAQALAAFREAAALAPDRPDYTYAVGLTLSHVPGAEAAQAAEAAFQAVLAVDPRSYASHAQLGLLAQRDGRPLAALDAYHKALAALEESIRAEEAEAAAAAAAAAQTGDSAATATEAQDRASGQAGQGGPRARSLAARRHSKRAGSIAGELSTAEGASTASSRPGLHSGRRLQGSGAALRGAPRDVRTALLERVGVCAAQLGHSTHALRFFAQCHTAHAQSVASGGSAWTVHHLALREAMAQLSGGNPVGAIASLGHASVAEVGNASATSGSAAGSGPAEGDEGFGLHHARSVAYRQLGDLAAALASSDRAAAHLNRRRSHQADAPSPSNTAATAPVFVDVPDATAHWLNRAYVLFEQEQYADAVHALDRARDADTAPAYGESVAGRCFRDARRAEAAHLRGRCLSALGAHGEAASSFLAAVQLLPALAGEASFCYAVGVALVAATTAEAETPSTTGGPIVDGDQRREALAWLTRALDVGESDTPAAAVAELSIRVLARHERAKLRQSLGDPAGAVEDFSSVLSVQPTNVHALVRRAFALTQVGDYAAAAVDWKTAERHDDTGVLAKVGVTSMYNVPYVELCEPGDEDPPENLC